LRLHFEKQTNIMGKLGPTEIILILAIVLLLFGGKKIPELMKGVGKGVKSFKDGMKEEDQDSKPDANAGK
jgi:sec-independent protein translocase protein TatA